MFPQKSLFSILNERLIATRRRLPLSTGLIVLSSAALGGIAVALWNRKALANFRELALEEQSKRVAGNPHLRNPHQEEAENNFY